MFKLLLIENIIVIIQIIKVIFKVNEIWLDVEYINGIMFIKLIIKIILMIILNKYEEDLFFFSMIIIFFVKFKFLIVQ